MFLALLMIPFSHVQAQDEHEKHKESGAHEAHWKTHRHSIHFAMGSTYIPKASYSSNIDERNIFVPTIGIDYFYKLAERWEIGVMLDYEFGTYLVLKEDDLERQNAFLTVATAAFDFHDGWNAVIGAGIELEEEENLGIIRLGLERKFSAERWIFGPSLFYDIKEGYDTWSLSLAIGYEL